MKYTIQLAKIPLISLIGIRNPYRAKIFSSEGNYLGRLRKEGRRCAVNLENARLGEASCLTAIEDDRGTYRIVNESGATLLKTVHRYNDIEILEPASGKMENFNFGAWSCPWGAIRISAFRTSIDVEIRDERRTAEFLLLGYLSYFTMSRIGH